MDCATPLYTFPYRDAVDIKGLDQVSLSDSITQSAIKTLVWVDGCNRGNGGAHSVRSLTENRDILFFRKLRSVIVFIHNADVDGGRGLQETSRKLFYFNGIIIEFNYYTPTNDVVYYYRSVFPLLYVTAVVITSCFLM